MVITRTHWHLSTRPTLIYWQIKRPEVQVVSGETLSSFYSKPTDGHLILTRIKVFQTLRHSEKVTTALDRGDTQNPPHLRESSWQIGFVIEALFFFFSLYVKPQLARKDSLKWFRTNLGLWVAANRCIAWRGFKQLSRLQTMHSSGIITQKNKVSVGHLWFVFGQ